jgi:catechol 2,3-dioxygenase-like lactoylglutathione lyase family enzyme
VLPAWSTGAVTTIAELLVADDPASWRACGFTVDDEGVCRIGSVRVRLDPAAGASGVVSWTLAGAPDEGVATVDGLSTAHGEPELAPASATSHPIGVRAIDHVVVLTPDPERTAGEVTRVLGLPVKRWRDGESAGRPVRQAFFRMGEVVLEVVGPPDPEPDGRPASFFGLALTLDDLDAACELLGPQRAGAPRSAVQAGRRIATSRSAAGLRVPVALMDPEPGRSR